ncbi:Afadin and alpha-actinin-binding-domain-containing protein [Xylariales sp. PMI_506]|nr:Afadin and alpha-actinin-binding-domain-containing protein [Xylariales sp. PMI_506]
MIEADNLRTASLYINNQLLSRGLLRDGQNIDFADPEAGAGLNSTMGKIMGVVNDLILRRDRDATHREHLSSTLLSLRADAQRHNTETTRLSDKLTDTQRKLDVSEGTERALRLQLKSAESTVHKMKEEMAKMKTLVAQSRAACANEIRKRDRQIDNLKKAVVDAGRVRGGGRNRDVVSISIVGDIGAESKRDGVARGGTEDERYSLRMETNEFLTELASGLSDENATLLSLVRRTVDGLREMSGFDASSVDEPMAGITGNEVLTITQKSAQELADELTGIMEHLRTILTNPSFVPIEEVEIRETEIIRLREGWERMEARWKDAVVLLDGWRKRMASGGKSVNMEELSIGLSLSPVRIREIQDTFIDREIHIQELSCVQEEDEEEEEEEEVEEEESPIEPPKSPDPAESLHLVPAPDYEVEEDDDSESSVFQEDVDSEEPEAEAEAPNIEVLHDTVSTSAESPPLPVIPHLSPLKDSYSSGNKGAAGVDGLYHKRPADFTTIAEERTREVAATSRDAAPPPPPHSAKARSPQKNLNLPPLLTEEVRQSSTASYESTLFGESFESPLRSNPTRKLFSKPSKQQSPESEPEVEPEVEPEPMQVEPTPSKSPLEQTAKTTRMRPSRTPATVSPKEVSKPTSGGRSTKRTASARNAPVEKPTPRVERAIKPATTARSKSPIRPPVSSRLPRRNNPPPPQSPITMAAIAAKLAASEREADAARVRAKLKAARLGRRGGAAAGTVADDANAVPSPQKALQGQQQQQQEGDPVKKDAPPPAPAARAAELEEDELAGPGVEEPQVVLPILKSEKRKRERKVSKAASRRRSTLSPWELESLIQGNVGPESPAK